MSTILTLYDMRKAVDANGKEITPEVGMVSGITRSVPHPRSVLRWFKGLMYLISHTKPYKSSMHVRDEKAKRLLDQIRAEMMSE